MEEKFNVTLGYGFFADDNVMKKYVDFICDRILEARSIGVEISRTDGFPMKGHYIPVKLTIKARTLRSADISMEVFGYTKEFTLFMSRRKSPDELLHQLQRKLDELALEVVIENKLDRDKIWNDYHPIRRFPFPL